MVARKPNYSEYYERLTSYTDWAGDSAVYVKALVEAGFVYSGESDTVFCYKCGIIVQNWTEDDDPIVRHETVNKACIFLSERSHKVLDGEQLPPSGVYKSLLDYEKESVVFDWIPGKGPQQRDLVEGNNAIGYDTTEPSHRSENIPNLNTLSNKGMRFERMRFESFATCPIQKHWPSPEVLSSAGFYYVLEKDVMKCFCCDATVESWESSSQDVTQKHKAMSPKCCFANGIRCGNVSIHNTEDDEEEEEDLTQERKLFGSLSIGTFNEKNTTRRENTPVQPYVHFTDDQRQGGSYQNNVHPRMTNGNNSSQRHTNPPCTGNYDNYVAFNNHQASLNSHQNSPQIHPPVERRTDIFKNGGAPTNGFYPSLGGVPKNSIYASQEETRKISNDLSDITKRLESFFTWPQTAYLQPFELAQAGFVYNLKGDAVKCYKCEVFLKNWEPGDNAWAEHEKWSPLCPLVIERIHAANQVRQYGQYGQPLSSPQQQHYGTGHPGMAQETSHSSLNENYLRRYQQQQQQQHPQHPQQHLQQGHRYLHESSRSLPTATAEKYKYGLRNNNNNPHNNMPKYIDNYRSSVTENLHNGYRVGGEQTTCPIQNASVVSSNQPHNVVFPGSNRHMNHTGRNYPEYSILSNGTKTQETISNDSHVRYLSSPPAHRPYEPALHSDVHSRWSENKYHSVNVPPTKKDRQNALSKEDLDKLVLMGFPQEVVLKTVDCYAEYASRSFASLDDLAQAVLYYQDHDTLEGTPFGKNLNVNPSKAGEEMIFNRANNDKPVVMGNEPNDMDRQGCKICMDNDVEVTFVPCGHLIVCESCALGMKECPICRIEIKETVRTYYFGN